MPTLCNKIYLMYFNYKLLYINCCYAAIELLCYSWITPPSVPYVSYNNSFVRSNKLASLKLLQWCSWGHSFLGYQTAVEGVTKRTHTHTQITYKQSLACSIAFCNGACCEIKLIKTHKNTHTYTHKHTRAQTRMYPYAHTQTHTQTDSLSLSSTNI